MIKEHQEWRKGRNNIWHFCNFFPGAPYDESVCERFIAGGFFDTTSHANPSQGFVCQECYEKSKGTKRRKP